MKIKLVCKEKFKSIMKVLKHVAKHHNKEADEEIKLEGELGPQKKAEER